MGTKIAENVIVKMDGEYAGFLKKIGLEQRLDFYFLCQNVTLELINPYLVKPKSSFLQNSVP